MKRLTDEAWRNLDPWECCGQDSYCNRGCHEEGGCTNGCVVPKLYVQLAQLEDLLGDLLDNPTNEDVLNFVLPGMKVNSLGRYNIGFVSKDESLNMSEWLKEPFRR